MARFDLIIPVYQTAPFLQETLASLQAQDDSDFHVQIRAVAFPDIRSQFSIPEALPIHFAAQGKGIGPDWEDALRLAQGDIATLAHSDDRYAPAYARRVREAFARWPEAGIAFTMNDYIETSFRLKTLLWIKRCLNPRRFAREASLISGKEMLRALRFGNFVPCPTVAFHLPVLKNLLGNQPIFHRTLKVALDWDNWATLAQQGVSFIYIPENLVTLRVHPEATTQKSIQTGERMAEETQILEKLWGRTLGKLLAKVFTFGQKLQRLS